MQKGLQYGNYVLCFGYRSHVLTAKVKKALLARVDWVIRYFSLEDFVRRYHAVPVNEVEIANKAFFMLIRNVSMEAIDG